jgi:hypothetical protein
LPLNCFASSAWRAVPRPASRRTFPRTWRRLGRESTTLEHRHRSRCRDYPLCDCPAIFREPPADFTAYSGRPIQSRPTNSIFRTPTAGVFPFFPKTPISVTGGRGRIRTSVARKERQIYSLLVLATHPPVPEKFVPFNFLQLLVPKSFSGCLGARFAKTQNGLVSKDTSPSILFLRIRSASFPANFLVELAEGIEPPTL